MDPFKNPLAPKTKKSSRTFAAPSKEQATTGLFMPPGDDYGVGFRVKVGTEKVTPYTSGPIPLKSKCMDPNNEF